MFVQTLISHWQNEKSNKRLRSFIIESYLENASSDTKKVYGKSITDYVFSLRSKTIGREITSISIIKVAASRKYIYMGSRQIWDDQAVYNFLFSKEKNSQTNPTLWNFDLEL